VVHVPLVRVNAEDLLEAQLRALAISGFVREYRFHPVRKWRFDFANPERRLAVEIEGFGAGGTAGRHQRFSGFSKDAEKYAEAAIAGWRLIRCTTQQVRNGTALRWIERAMQ
jgi:very-short-patch-repair endonuclease